MTMRATGINPRVLTWARERTVLSLEEAAGVLRRPASSLAAWEAGDAHPTWNQLEDLARIYARPVAVFFFPEPPREPDAESEFRRVATLDAEALTPDTRLAVREGHAWQASLRELAGPVNPSRRFILRDIPTPGIGSAAALASRVRDYLGVTVDVQQRWSGNAMAFKQWRTRVEEAGVFVFKRSFTQDDVSGFCLHDDEFPVIVINNSTAHARQIFTLFHELGHLLFRVSGITHEAGRNGSPVQALERACDAFAHEFLVPNDSFPAAELRIADDLRQGVTDVAGRYNVSRLVILRKAHDLGVVGLAAYREISREWRAEYRARRAGEAGGGTYYANRATYLGDAYLRLAFQQLHSGRVTLPELAEHLDMKARNVAKLEDHLLARK